MVVGWLHREKKKTVTFQPALVRFSGKAWPLLFFALFSFSAPGFSAEIWNGQRIMDEALKRHQLYPYIYEEQTMILIDSVGNQDVRKLRRFSRVEKDGTTKFFMVLDNPIEVRGVALLSIRYPSGRMEGGLYLPAFGKELKTSAQESSNNFFLGTDFAIVDLTFEILSDFRYGKIENQIINKTSYLVVDAFPRDNKIEQATGYGQLRHFIHPDNFFIIRTDYFDRRGRLFKRRTYHDLKIISGDMWQPNMILMENLKERHKTLIKVDRRVFSNDYVPEKMFNKEWVLTNQHVQSTEKRLFQEIAQPSSEAANKTPGEKNSDIKAGTVKR